MILREIFTELYRFACPVMNRVFFSVLIVTANVVLLLSSCAVYTSSEQSEVTENALSEPPEVAEDDSTESADGVQEILDSMSIEQKVLQMFIVTPEAVACIDPVTEIDENTGNVLGEYPVGGMVLFGKNIVEPDQLKSMLAGIRRAYEKAEEVPPFLCVDEEGGTVARLAGTESFLIGNVGNMCDIPDEEAAYSAGKYIGEYLKEYGFNLDFAPVADLYTAENNSMKYRSFGSDPEEVSLKIQAFSEGLREQDILYVLKHFPGIGSSVGDTHTGRDVIDKTVGELLALDLIPFIDGIDAGTDFIMISHVSAPAVTGDDTPCSLSGTIITELLRTRLGYEGIVITDAMNMQAVTDYYTAADAACLAVEAGADMLLMPQDFETAYQGLLDAVASGRISEGRIDESVKRILEVKLKTIY